jgi:hypothetical protein
MEEGAGMARAIHRGSRQLHDSSRSVHHYAPAQIGCRDGRAEQHNHSLNWPRDRIEYLSPYDGNLKDHFGAGPDTTMCNHCGCHNNFISFSHV